VKAAIGALGGGRSWKHPCAGRMTSVPGESHELGLLMTGAVLTVEGACCIGPGPQTPLPGVRTPLDLDSAVAALAGARAGRG